MWEVYADAYHSKVNIVFLTLLDVVILTLQHHKSFQEVSNVKWPVFRPLNMTQSNTCLEVLE